MPPPRVVVAVSTHSRLKAAGMVGTIKLPSGVVSTHSRLKAAGDGRGGAWFRGAGFNTQPPEGGWAAPCAWTAKRTWFQHTAA